MLVLGVPHFAIVLLPVLLGQLRVPVLVRTEKQKTQRCTTAPLIVNHCRRTRCTLEYSSKVYVHVYTYVRTYVPYVRTRTYDDEDFSDDSSSFWQYEWGCCCCTVLCVFRWFMCRSFVYAGVLEYNYFIIISKSTRGPEYTVSSIATTYHCCNQ